LCVLAPLSAAVIVLHNLADPINASQFGSFGWLWNIAHQSGLIRVGGVTIIVAYPLGALVPE